MSGARVPFAMARDGYFFKSIAEVHPRFRTPSVAIIVQCALAIVLLLLGGNFRQFFSLAIFAEWLFYMIAGSTVFVFRHRDPQADRPYRVWGYPLVPAIFVLVSGVLLGFTFKGNLPNSAYGTLAILLGIPVFYIFKRRKQLPQSNQNTWTISSDGYQRTGAGDTFTPCPISPKVKTPAPSALPSPGPLWSQRNGYVQSRLSIRPAARKEVGLANLRSQLWAARVASFCCLIVFGMLMPEKLKTQSQLSRHRIDPDARVEARTPPPAEAAAGACQDCCPRRPSLKTPKLIVPREDPRGSAQAAGSGSRPRSL